MTLLQRIHTRARLTLSEQKIVAFFKQNMNELAFETVTSISKKADVSKATVVRFIASLGYDGFADFQQQLRDQMVDQLQSPITRLPQMKEKLLPDGANVLEQSFAHIISSLNKTMATIDRDRFMHIARLLADGNRRVFIDGHRNSGGLAQILWLKLQYLRPQAHLLSASIQSMPDVLVDINETDILFSITQSRYCNATRRISKYFAESKATVIMLTDSDWMPYEDKNYLKLVANSEGMFVFNNACSMLALIESLILAIAQMCENSVYERSRRHEKLFEYFDTFVSGTPGK